MLQWGGGAQPSTGKSAGNGRNLARQKRKMGGASFGLASADRRSGRGLWGGTSPRPVPRDGVLWSGFHKGGTPLCPGSGGGQPLGRTTSGGESRDSKGRLWSPFSAEHRLRCITALFVPFRSVLWRGRRGYDQAEAFLLFCFRTATDDCSQSGCQSQSQRDIDAIFCYTVF